MFPNSTQNGDCMERGRLFRVNCDKIAATLPSLSDTPLAGATYLTNSSKGWPLCWNTAKGHCHSAILSEQNDERLWQSQNLLELGPALFLPSCSHDIFWKFVVSAKKKGFTFIRFPAKARPMIGFYEIIHRKGAKKWYSLARGAVPLEWRLSPIQLMEASYSRREKLLVNNFFTSVVHRNTSVVPAKFDTNEKKKLAQWVFAGKAGFRITA